MEEILFFLEGKVEYPPFFSKEGICKWLQIIADHYQKEIGAINFIFCDV